MGPAAGNAGKGFGRVKEWREGKISGQTGHAADFTALAVEDDNGRRQIWTYDIASQRSMQLTRDGDHWAPLWTAVR
jgi:hypothetical protein